MSLIFLAPAMQPRAPALEPAPRQFVPASSRGLKALAAASLALQGDGRRRVSLDRLYTPALLNEGVIGLVCSDVASILECNGARRAAWLAWSLQGIGWALPAVQ